jgi:hypothetical protein
VSEPAKPLLTTALLALICAVILGAALPAPSWMTLPVAPVAIVLMHSVLKFQAASQSARMLPAKRRSGELELLLTTPYDEDEILRGCLRELKRGLFWPALIALGVDALLILDWQQSGVGDALGWAALVVVEVIWMLANLYSLSWAGLYLGLRLGSPAKAAGRAIFYVVLLPWFFLVCFAALAALLAGRPALLPAPDFGILLALVFVIAAVFCNLYSAGWAVNELRERFRALAAGS